MKILCSRKSRRSLWKADCTDLPGSPPIGAGTSKHAAVINLLFVLLSYEGTNTLDTNTLEIEYKEE
jgi:hypothetical protein